MNSFYSQPFFHMLSKLVTVQCQSPIFGLHVETNELNNHAYVKEIMSDKSSFAHLFSSLKTACNKICGIYIVSINGKPIFTKEAAIAALHALFDGKATYFIIDLPNYISIYVSIHPSIYLNNH